MGLGFQRKKCEDDDTIMYPNPNFTKYFPDAELPADNGCDERSSCIRIGTFMVIEKLPSSPNFMNVFVAIRKFEKIEMVWKCLF